MLKKLYVLLIFLNTQLFSLVIIDNHQHEYDNFTMDYFYDAKSTLNISEINDLEFKNKTSNNFTFGYIDGSTWFKIQIQNLSDEEDYILSFSEAIWKTLDLYYQKDGIYYKVANGLDIPLSKRSIKDVKPTFNIHVDKNSTRVFFIRGQTIASQIGSFTIVTKDIYYNPSKITITHIYIIFAFVLLIIVILNAYSYQLTKDSSYIYYILYTLASILFSVMHSGSYLLLNLNGWNEGLHVVGTFVILFLLLFSDKFLELKSNIPSVHKFFKISAIIFLIFSILIYNNVAYSGFVFNLYSALFFTVLFYAVIKVYMQGFSGAKFYLVALLIYAPLMGLMILTFNSLLTYSMFTRHSFLAGNLIEIIFFTLILTAKYKSIILEKVKTQNKLLDEKIIVEEIANKSIALFGKNVIASNTDPKGFITYASEALCDISGYAQDELIAQPHNIFRHEDMPSQLFKEMWDRLKSGKTWEGEIKNRKKDGGYYWVRSTILPDYDNNGVLIGYKSIRHNITAQKVKEEFMANMSHELRTPLNAIIGFSNILTKKQTNSEHIKLSKQISTSSKSLLSLINDILDLSKIQNSSFTIEPFEFNAYDEIIDSSHQFEALTAKKALIFKKHISSHLKNTFFGDWHRISQIILNLISNAVKFTPKDGEIIFDVDYKKDSLVVCITDNGIGMDKETQDRIFKPFEQADGSTTRKYGGTGLGLSITQNLVELMHGKIVLESQKNAGSKFTVTIPLEMIEDNVEKLKKVEFTEKEKEDSLNGHILIVEDNKTNQMLIQMLIGEFGLTCDIANDGVEAVEMYNPDKYSLVLMDENMPNMNGIEAMKAIREKHQDRCGAIIALTANAMDGDREKFLNIGMDEYIAKPIDEDELYITIRKFI